MVSFYLLRKTVKVADYSKSAVQERDRVPVEEHNRSAREE
jgi:hypothetical protein